MIFGFSGFLFFFFSKFFNKPKHANVLFCWFLDFCFLGISVFLFPYIQKKKTIVNCLDFWILEMFGFCVKNLTCSCYFFEILNFGISGLFFFRNSKHELRFSIFAFSNFWNSFIQKLKKNAHVVFWKFLDSLIFCFSFISSEKSKSLNVVFCFGILGFENFWISFYKNKKRKRYVLDLLICWSVYFKNQKNANRGFWFLDVWIFWMFGFIFLILKIQIQCRRRFFFLQKIKTRSHCFFWISEFPEFPEFPEFAEFLSFWNSRIFFFGKSKTRTWHFLHFLILWNSWIFLFSKFKTCNCYFLDFCILEMFDFFLYKKKSMTNARVICWFFELLKFSGFCFFFTKKSFKKHGLFFVFWIFGFLHCFGFCL